MLIRILAVILLVTTVAAWPVETALACSCVPRDPGPMLEQADAAFIGRVVSYIDPPMDGVWSSSDPVTYTFAVESVAKGDLSAFVQVVSAFSGASCGFEGGIDADTVTVNGLTYTAVDTCAAACTEWDIDCCNCMGATNLALAITCDGRTPVTVPTHDTTAAAVCAVVTITADEGSLGNCIDLASSSAGRLLTSGLFLTGGLGREVIEIDLVGATSGEISMPYFNHPMNLGIFIDYIAGTTGRLTIIYE